MPESGYKLHASTPNDSNEEVSPFSLETETQRGCIFEVTQGVAGRTRI